VSKLLIQCNPDIAVFGEKDYQQLKVVTRMAADLDLPVRIVGAPIVRERDGLAMSSRNAYLSEPERKVAPTLHRVLKECALRIGKGELLARVLDEGAAALDGAGFAIDYLEARHAETLAKIDTTADVPVRLLVAARLGRTRLIDNIAV
jgi:pantoate--beta-alanine ligase